jgi:3-deoxy-7-phosphoheptulonate synthase
MERKATRTDGGDERSVVQVGSVRFGHDPFPVIAGPCAVESQEQIMDVARAVAETGGSVLRGAAFKQDRFASGISDDHASFALAFVDKARESERRR